MWKGGNLERCLSPLLQDVVLTKEVIQEGLSDLGRTAGGTKIAFLTLCLSVSCSRHLHRCTFTFYHNQLYISISLVPRFPPAFCRLQYRKRGTRLHLYAIWSEVTPCNSLWTVLTRLLRQREKFPSYIVGNPANEARVSPLFSIYELHD